MAFGSVLGDLGTQIKKNFDGLKNDFQSQINGATGQAATGTNVAGDVLPWDNVNSRFFLKISIDPERWDKLFPYRFIVIDTSKGNQIVNGTQNMDITIRKDVGRTAIEFAPMQAQWMFTLPITPGQLRISDAFAINTTPTLLGINEEHSGLRFKMINISGTMGVWPYRESVTQPPGNPDLVQSVFGGTIEAAGSVLNQIARTVNTATSGHPAPKPVSKSPRESTSGLGSTGYYQALALQQFLEQYAEAKRNPNNASWRLVLDMPKTNQSLIVTPMIYDWLQSAQKPAEIMYTMQLKAWRRIDLKAKFSEESSVQPLTPGLLQRVLNSVSEARATLSSIIDLIGAVRSDVTRPLEVLRQTSMFIKDLAGVVLTAADLPFQIQRDYKYAINDFLQSISTSSTLRLASSDPQVSQALKDLKVGWNKTEGLGSASINSGQLGTSASQAQAVDPGMAIFDKPERHHSLMDIANVFSLNLNQAQQERIESVVTDTRLLSIDDLKGFRSVINELTLQLSNSFGAGDAFYNQVYNRPPPISRIQPMTLDEYDILTTLYDVVKCYDLLTATTDIDDLNKKSNMDYVAGLASESGIEFNTSQSKILAPVPFGLTIETIALRYLGDSQRWLEIVTLNNLRSPYIDENGFKLPLLSNASGRQITVSTDENLYVGQRVVLNSFTQTPAARKILSIDRLSDVSFLLSLDGEANLDNFTTLDSAYLQAYLPGTVNSQQKIFIPSDLPVPTDPSIIPPAASQSDALTGLSKVDWLMTDTGDIAVNSYGDFRLSYGMTNIMQAIKIKLATKKGTVLLHPDFGIGIKVGQMTSDTDAKVIFDDINRLIAEDPRFQGLDSLQVVIDGPIMTINMGVKLAGNQGVFPIAFELAA